LNILDLKQLVNIINFLYQTIH